MKFAVIGATGLVGNATVQELAARGHEVTAFARHVENVFASEQVKAVVADVNAPDFFEQLQGFDGVVSAFNAGWNNPNLATELKTGNAAIVKAAQMANVPYLLVIGGAGSLNVAPGLQLVDTPDFPKEFYPAANEVRVLLNDLRDRRDVNWAFLSPAAMFAVNPVRFERTGEYRIGQDDVLLDADGEPADISVADLAVAIADDVEKRAHLFARFTVAEK